MSLNGQQIAQLMRMIADASPDCLDCEGCYDQIAEFADRQLKQQAISDAMREVENHLKQCPCCHNEYQVLLEGLKEMEQQQDVPASEQPE